MRLTHFAKAYPLIFEALDSALKYSLLDLCIVELLHGFVWLFYDLQTPIKSLDSKLWYLMGDKHKMRDEQCGVFKQNSDPTLAYCAAQHLD